MTTAILVERDITDGDNLLTSLDRRGLIIDTCAWSFGFEANSWFLNMATPLADRFGLEATILSILQVLRETDLTSISFLNLTVLRDTDGFPRALRVFARQYPLVEIWYSGGALGGTDLGNVYVYRCYSQVVEHHGFYIGVELMPRRDTSFKLRLKVYPPVRLQRKAGGPTLLSESTLRVFTRTVGITDEAAAVVPRRLLDDSGPQPRVWAFLTQRGLDYARRIVDLVLDGHGTAVITEREVVLSSESEDFPFMAQDGAALLEAEFDVGSRV
ncbi:MAG TPA: hypothetical protein VKV26_06975 [Dehalococcoidia bacterium]|nr:hypothetical protein [Dehalococcoidia bacterium]